jgi:hypothetical protein
MKCFILVILACLPGLAARAQAPPAASEAGYQLADFIPKNYVLPEGNSATGDLNHDRRPDVALVLVPKAEATFQDGDADLPPRLLLVLLAAPTGGYALTAKSSRFILCKDCGGQYGDPFAGISISKGVLEVLHYGGSSWRWGITSKFRYQQNDFYLIGETRNYGRNDGDCEGLDGPAGEDFLDTNFLTGDYEVRKISDECKLLVHKRGRHKPTALRRLADYTHGD